MSITRARYLIGRALHPGVSLAHNPNEIMPVEALIAMGRIKKEPHGALVLHAKHAGESLEQVRAVVLMLALEIFAQQEWVVHPRKKYTRDDTMRMFANQVWREFFGEPCETCKGHGVLGQKLDSVRHRMAPCEVCANKGYIMRPFTGDKVKAFKGMGSLRVPCETCRGNRYVQITEALKAGKLRSCSACSGTGTVKSSLRARGRALQYDHQHVRRVWIDRFTAVLVELRRIELASLYECVDYLYGPNT